MAFRRSRLSRIWFILEERIQISQLAMIENSKQIYEQQNWENIRQLCGLNPLMHGRFYRPKTKVI